MYLKSLSHHLSRVVLLRVVKKSFLLSDSPLLKRRAYNEGDRGAGKERASALTTGYGQGNPYRITWPVIVASLGKPRVLIMVQYLQTGKLRCHEVM